MPFTDNTETGSENVLVGSSAFLQALDENDKGKQKLLYLYFKRQKYCVVMELLLVIFLRVILPFSLQK